MMRTTKKTVTFKRPFLLGGLDDELPAGDYATETDEELIEGISFPVYRRVTTSIELPSTPGQPGRREMLIIEPNELDAAILRDRALRPDRTDDPTTNERGTPRRRERHRVGPFKRGAKQRPQKA